MNQINTRKLYKKYPKIFAQHKLSMKETAMCWGFDCGDGWYNLIDALSYYIQQHVYNHTKSCKQVEAVQVKEKFGGLRFYYEGGDDYISDIVSFAENLSYKICENCGSMDKVTQTKGWIVTLCPKCLKKRQKRLK